MQMLEPDSEQDVAASNMNPARTSLVRVGIVLGAAMGVSAVLILLLASQLSAPEMNAPPGWKNTPRSEVDSSTKSFPAYYVQDEMGAVSLRALAKPASAKQRTEKGAMFLYADDKGKELLTIFTSVKSANYETVRASAEACEANGKCSESRRKAIETELGPAYVFRPKDGDWMVNVALDENPKSQATLTVAAFSSKMRPEEVLDRLREYRSE